MSQQGSGLRKTVQAIRRHKFLFAIIVAAGIAFGGFYSILKPPALTSEALVVLPQSGVNESTQVVLATSDAVLQGASRSISPAMSVPALSGRVQARSVTSNIIGITASSSNGATAIAIADGVAESYVSYVSSAVSPVGHVPARLLQSATKASGTTLPKQTVMFGLIGGIAGAVIALIVVIGLSRGDKRLRERDAIANSIGVPVLAAVPAQNPSDAPGWAKLFQEYEPDAVYAWQLRKVLQHLGVATPGEEAGSRAAVTVLSFSSDKAALALGPQLAAFAASQSIPTLLVTGPQQGDAAAGLFAACGTHLTGTERSRYLKVAVTEDGEIAPDEGTRLLVVVVVLDDATPRVPPAVRTQMALAGVSAGVATAEQLARAAMAAAVDGREVTGVLVGNPDPADRTSGRVPQPIWPTSRKVPTRVTGIPTEIRR
jgi:capsular polysaccharide biosynthesis protein